jgi:hypothetical protein
MPEHPECTFGVHEEGEGGRNTAKGQKIHF